MGLKPTGSLFQQLDWLTPLGGSIMQKATLAAALAAVLGFALNTNVLAADAGAPADKTTSKTESTTKTEKDTATKKGHKKDKKETKETKTTDSAPAK
jgi:hypothetical protein